MYLINLNHFVLIQILILSKLINSKKLTSTRRSFNEYGSVYGQMDEFNLNQQPEYDFETENHEMSNQFDVDDLEGMYQFIQEESNLKNINYEL